MVDLDDLRKRIKKRKEIESSFSSKLHRETSKDDRDRLKEAEYHYHLANGYGHGLEGYPEDVEKAYQAFQIAADLGNTTPSLSIEDFKSIFRWAIIEQQGKTVLLNWDNVLEIINRSTGKNYSRNKLREMMAIFGKKSYISLSAVVNQIGEIMRLNDTGISARSSAKNPSVDKPKSYRNLLDSASKGLTSSQILAPFVINRRRKDAYGVPFSQVKISWKELLRFINDDMGYSISEKEMREYVQEYGEMEYIDECSIVSGLTRLLSFYMFKDVIYACSIGPINIGNIRKSDIDWDKLLYVVRERHGLDMKQWQFFDGSAAQSTSLWNIINNIQVKATLHDLIIHFKE